MDIRKTVHVKPGRYVIAVSGGIDSVVLLDLVRQLPEVKLVVAHFDHGIRVDSKNDKELVKKLALKYQLPFVYDEGRLGAGASEEEARNARYAFLRKVQQQTSSDGILIAHHLNDVIETAVQNILRGTGRKGMTSLKSVDGILRPLLHLPKEHLHRYALDNQLVWREDSTNLNTDYRRNYIRHTILPKLQQLSPEKYQRLIQNIKRQHDLNIAIDRELQTILHIQPNTSTLRRYDVTKLPHAVSRELVGEWLRNNGKRQFSSKQLERMVIAIKTARPHTHIDIDKDRRMSFDKEYAHLYKAASPKK